jgi:cytochrome c oxidase assembly protein subunit 16
MSRFKFASAKYSASSNASKSAIYRHPFLLFGLPFITMVVIGSFALTPATATRYGHYDKKVRRTDRKDAIDASGVKRRRFDPREEYYVSVEVSMRSFCHWLIVHAEIGC